MSETLDYKSTATLMNVIKAMLLEDLYRRSDNVEGVKMMVAVNDGVINVFFKQKKHYQHWIYDLSLEVEHREAHNKIEIMINVTKHIANDNPAGNFAVNQLHSVFLSPPGDKYPGTLPHPSFVVEYIMTGIFGQEAE